MADSSDKLGAMTRRGGSGRSRTRPAQVDLAAEAEWPADSCTASWARSMTAHVTTSFLGFAIFVVAEGWLASHGHIIACCLGALFLGVAVPLTHMLGKSRYRDWRSLFSQIGGAGEKMAPGWRFQVFQLVGWSFFVTALALALAPLASALQPAGGWGKPDGMAVLAGAAGVISEVFIVGSVLTFKDKPAAPFKGEGGGRARAATLSRGGGGERASPVGLAPFLSANMALAAVGAGLAGSSFLWDRHGGRGGVLAAAASLACLSVAVPLTHGLGGRLIHKRAGREGWSFWQPFEGGKRFVLLQGLGWSAFASALALFIVGAHRAMVRARGAGRAIAGAGLAGLAAEVLLVSSLACFRHLPPARGDPPPLHHRGEAPVSAWEGEQRMVGGPHGSRGGLRTRLRALGIILGMYAGQYVTIALVFAPPLLASPMRVALLYLCYVAVYGWTYWGAPHVTGAWHCPERARRMAVYAEDAAWSWFGGVRLVKSFAGPMNPGRQYVFGYHPHGLCPATAAWIHHTGEWKELFPGVEPCTLVASVLLKIPIFREMLMWSGVRDVGRQSFRRALLERRHVLVIPGGQAELVVDEKRHDRVTLYTRHRGFVREAIDAGASLVPMFCFGESRALVNAVRMPAVQRWTYRTFGFPVPYIPAGWGAGFLPLPRPVPLAVVVGEPVDVSPPPGTTPKGAEMEAHIEAACASYYAALRSLFESHKHDHGYGQTELVLSHHGHLDT